MEFRNLQGYLDSMNHILLNGEFQGDRTGVGTFSVFGSINLEFDLYDPIQGERIVPIPSSKKVLYEKYFHELIWMLSGSSRVKYLLDNGVRIWNEWVIPGTEVWGRELAWADRVREVERVGKLAEFTAWRATLPDPDNLNVLSTWMDKQGIPSKELLDGDLGPVYGAQWRGTEDLRKITSDQWAEHRESLEERGFSVVGVTRKDEIVIERRIDQIAQIEQVLKHNPNSRRTILSAWNVSRLDEMALPPCHTLAQWKPRMENGVRVLDCKLYQRSGDYFLGVCYNFGFYAVLTHMLACLHGYRSGKLYHTFGDAHIYSNHVEQVKEQLSLGELPDSAPRLTINRGDNSEPYTSITQFQFKDLVLGGYKSRKLIKAPIAK